MCTQIRHVVLVVLSLVALGCGSESEDGNAIDMAGAVGQAGSGGESGSGGEGAAGGQAGDAVSNIDVLALLESACGVCHAATFPTLVMIDDWPGMTSQQSDLPIITAGDHMSSYVYHKVADTHLDEPANGSGLKMPMGGAVFSEAELAAVAAWIDGL